MKKRLLRRILVLLVLLLTFATPAIPMASASPTSTPSLYPPSSLVSLTHNCPNTGIMVPETFNPLNYSYILTVASWVSRVTITPVSLDPVAMIYVNGQYNPSGQTSQEFDMTNNPQAVTIMVTTGSETSVYTVFLQRRPSEARTRVSIGYLKNFYQSGGKWYAKLDLVTVTYGDGYTNYTSSYTNETTALYNHAIATNCIFYTGSQNNPTRYREPNSFLSHITLNGSEMFRVIYLEDEIVALIPYDIH
ncbi:MAG: cadherin-like beta sandwich domain-containing protein [Clostridiales bacterium]|nr:cadherin-like beta sandwich domain-containing protein [Clostridiales bacterium]